MNRFVIVILALLAVPIDALALELEGDFVQGGFVLGKTTPGTKVSLSGNPLRVSPDGRFVFGFGRDAKPTARLIAVHADGQREARTLEIKPRRYNIQRINGLPGRKVTPNAQDMKRIRAESERIAAAKALDTAQTGFLEGFIWPTKGRISGVYGSQRILNGKPRRPHLGIDIAAPKGTPVLATASGTVSLAERDLFFNGGTIMIDHGHGILSIYSHLSAVNVRVGQRVAQGERIGAVGSTGRSTGAHLDWRVQHFNTRLDPALLAGPMPK